MKKMKGVLYIAYLKQYSDLHPIRRGQRIELQGVLALGELSLVLSSCRWPALLRPDATPGLNSSAPQSNEK